MPEITPIADVTQMTAHTQTGSALLNRIQPPGEDVPRETTAPVVEEPKKEDLKEEEDPRFQALSRKEKLLLEERKQIAEERKRLEEEFAPTRKLQQLSKTNKLDALRELGLTYDDLTNLVINQQPLTEEQKIEAKVQELVEKRIGSFEDKQQKMQVEQQQRQYEQVLQNLNVESKQFIAKNAAEFPLVNDYELSHTITEFIVTEHAKTGIVISVEEAARQIETRLEEKVLQAYKIEKIRSKLTPQEPTKQAPAEQTSQQPKTLTHKQTATPPGGRALTDAERKQRAIDAFHGRLS